MHPAILRQAALSAATQPAVDAATQADIDEEAAWERVQETPAFMRDKADFQRLILARAAARLAEADVRKARKQAKTWLGDAQEA